MIARFCAESYNYPYDPSCPKALQEGTDGRVEPFSGFYSENNDKYKIHSVNKCLLTRVGINRRRATSEEEILYSIEVLSEIKEKKSVIYRSSVIIKDDHLAGLVANFINHHSLYFRLGGATSRGLGKVEIKANAIEPKKEVEPRIQKFNEELKKRWEEWGKLYGVIPLKNRTYFTLDLQSDAVLFNERCRLQFAKQENTLLSLVPKDDSDPEKKSISIRDDHGKDILQSFAKKICRSPYVKKVVNSLPFNPKHKKFYSTD
ncbi:hypothetical protein ACE1CI_36250 [Aerosakkonemataceae cyanobacterium BLCC-F50]|uniref:Uncharacterized protein n=1 Tax=Floridaenema flaviceps BLCC-F50 TaxID=3153642 RepID=A0ABV4Y3W7_9CYAN